MKMLLQKRVNPVWAKISKNQMDIQYITIFVFISMLASFSFSQVYGQDQEGGAQEIGVIVYDDDYTVEKFTTGLVYPTTMTFVGEDIFVLEKNTGKVFRVQDNGVMYIEPVLDVPVISQQSAGLLGIASTSNHVYLYFTESLSGFDEYNNFDNSRNTVYQYDWNGENLINPILIKELPSVSYHHLGGVMTESYNDEVYFVIGSQRVHAAFQNVPGDRTYETSSIFKIDTRNNNSVELFAMGIRNSFGLDIDPVTGYLWETENGPDKFDEINLVKPRFNSGWEYAMGPAMVSVGVNGKINYDRFLIQLHLQPFENFEYSEPEFSWYSTVAPTAIAFPDKDGFTKYSDWLFAGDWETGTVYNFQLNSDRTGFVFSTPGLSDLVLDDNDKRDEIIFADGFQGVVDIKFHDGVMYVLTYGDGSIYKIYLKERAEEKKTWNAETLKLLKTRTGSEYVNLSNTDFREISLDNVNISNVNLTSVNLSHADLTGKDLTGTILRGADLTNANLTGVDLTGIDLTGAKLSGLDLSDKDLTGTILRGADLTNANLTGVDLTGIDLTGAKLSGLDLSDKDLTGTILRGADLTNANLTGVDLTDKDLTGTILRGSDLTNANLTGIDLSGRDLTGVKLSGLALSDKDLTGTMLREVDLTNVNLTGVDLSGRDLTGVKLSGLDLSDKDLTGTMLREVDLSDKYLTGAKLSGLDLSDKDLTGAKLSGLDLSDKDLTGTILYRTDFTDTILPNDYLSGKNFESTLFIRVDLSGKDLSYSDFTYANFADANLENANLSHAVFVSTDLTKIKNKSLAGADLSGASFAHSNLSGVDLTGVTLGATNFWNTDLSGHGSTIIYDINTFLYHLNNAVQKLFN